MTDVNRKNLVNVDQKNHWSTSTRKKKSLTNVNKKIPRHILSHKQTQEITQKNKDKQVQTCMKAINLLSKNRRNLCGAGVQVT